MLKIKISMQQVINYCGYELFAYIRQNYLKYKICLKSYSREKSETNQLKAIIQDDFFSIVHAQVQFFEGQIVGSICTCEKNKSIPCEHIALLLLSQAFTNDDNQQHPVNYFNESSYISSYKEFYLS